MKITKTTKHGQSRWKVDLGRRENGQRVRKFFRTREDAETFANRHKEGVRENGQKWARHFAWLSVHEQAEMMRQHERLSHLGYTLREAVDFIAASRKPAPAAPLETAVNEFISIKEARGLRDRSFRKVRASVRMFCEQIGPQLPLRSVTETHVQDFLARNGWKPATRKTYLGDVKAFFRWCVRRKLVADSPAENVEAPLLEDEPPGIVTVAQAKAVLSACQRERPSLLGWLALCLFAGMRPEEARRLTWENIGGKYVEVAGAKAKTRQRRLVPITEQLRAWLDSAQATGLPLAPLNWRKKFDHVREAAGVLASWPHNALRHAFASFHLARHGNEHETANIMGNSPQMLYAHYRELVTPEDARAFFALRPDAAAIAAGIERELADMAAAMEGRRQATVRRWEKRVAPVSIPLALGACNAYVGRHYENHNNPRILPFSCAGEVLAPRPKPGSDGQRPAELGCHQGGEAPGEDGGGNASGSLGDVSWRPAQGELHCHH